MVQSADIKRNDEDNKEKNTRPADSSMSGLLDEIRRRKENK